MGTLKVNFSRQFSPKSGGWKISLEIFSSLSLSANWRVNSVSLAIGASSSDSACRWSFEEEECRRLQQTPFPVLLHPGRRRGGLLPPNPVLSRLLATDTIIAHNSLQYLYLRHPCTLCGGVCALPAYVRQCLEITRKGNVQRIIVLA